VPGIDPECREYWGSMKEEVWTTKEVIWVTAEQAQHKTFYAAFRRRIYGSPYVGILKGTAALMCTKIS
jgi:hypothetical protein